MVKIGQFTTNCTGSTVIYTQFVLRLSGRLSAPWRRFRTNGRPSAYSTAMPASAAQFGGAVRRTRFSPSRQKTGSRKSM